MKCVCLFRILLGACTLGAWTLSGCTPQKLTGKLADSTEASHSTIAFVTMHIERSGNESKVTLLSLKSSAGSFKQPGDFAGANYLTIESYESGKLAYVQSIEHPLFKEIEYPDSASELKTKTVSLAAADFFYRVQLHSDHSTVRMFETLANEPRHELSTFELSVP